MAMDHQIKRLEEIEEERRLNNPEYDSALTEEEKNLDDTEECEMCHIRTLPSELSKNSLGMWVCEHCR